jgi:hypothetical protein
MQAVQVGIATMGQWSGTRGGARRGRGVDTSRRRAWRRLVPMVCTTLATVVLVGVLAAAAHAAFYVATTGNDANPGTATAPWRTIQKAANSVTPGSTVYVRSGIYRERVTVRVSGTAALGPIVFRNVPGQIPILDGADLTITDDRGGFYLANRSFVRIQGFEIRNYRTANPDHTPAGIWVVGAGQGIQLRNNRIHRIANIGRGGNAHGIAVYGTRAPAALRNIVIDGNELFDLWLGASESLVVNGNVDGFRITNNHVHDNDNIGIDAIGHERVAPDPAFDQARNGVIRGNHIHHIDASPNLAYEDVAGANGIYIDGGRNIVIEQNRVHHNNIGIEVASEHAGKSSSGVTVRNNFVYRNDFFGITLGGYDEERGFIDNVWVVNNTLLENDQRHFGNGEIALQFDVRHTTIKNNIVRANRQGVLLSNPFTANTGNTVDSNLFFVPPGTVPRWQWSRVEHRSFAAWRRTTGNDVHSLYADPQLVSTALPNLHLRATSPAIDRGQRLAAAGRRDIDGEPRQRHPHRHRCRRVLAASGR